jgi:hypothetical protein
MDVVAYRAGYIYDHEGTIEDLTFGFGAGYKGFTFDYASVPQSKYLDERVSKFSLNAAPTQPDVDFFLKGGMAFMMTPAGFNEDWESGLSLSAGADIPFVEFSPAARLGSTLEMIRLGSSGTQWRGDGASLTITAGTLDLKLHEPLGPGRRLRIIGGLGGYNFNVRYEEDPGELSDQDWTGETALGVKGGVGLDIGSADGISFTADVACHLVLTEDPAISFVATSAGFRF